MSDTLLTLISAHTIHVFFSAPNEIERSSAATYLIDRVDDPGVAQVLLCQLGVAAIALCVKDGEWPVSTHNLYSDS